MNVRFGSKADIGLRSWEMATFRLITDVQIAPELAARAAAIHQKGLFVVRQTELFCYRFNT